MKITLVKIISTELDNLKRRLVKVLRFGKSDIQTPFEAAPYGIDANPIKDMIAVYIPTSEKGKNVIIGYINKNLKADSGELRFFSTDKDGNEKFYTWLKNDGTFEIGGTDDFAVKYNKLETAFNQLKQDFNLFVTTKYNIHTHTGVTSGVSSTATTPAVGTSSNADITPAKNSKIKTIG